MKTSPVYIELMDIGELAPAALFQRLFRLLFLAGALFQVLYLGVMPGALWASKVGCLKPKQY